MPSNPLADLRGLSCGANRSVQWAMTPRGVEEAAFEPQGTRAWRVGVQRHGAAPRRHGRTVDLDLNAPGITLAQALLDQLDALRKRLAPMTQILPHPPMDQFARASTELDTQT